MGFSAPQAARLTGCSASQLNYWHGCGLIVARGDELDGPYAFRDLVALRMVRSLLDAGLPLARIRRAVAAILDTGDDIAGLRVVTDGEHVWACRDDGQILDALRHGQLALFVAVDQMAADVDAEVRAFSQDRQTFVDRLRGSDHPAGSG
ncbi:MAG TPA: MerR family transcriptional regulator [Acidimicrobiia bacterium]|nr:MerR family transcriptional regulator [Acidimicrobiia bacterium]